MANYPSGVSDNDGGGQEGTPKVAPPELYWSSPTTGSTPIQTAQSSKEKLSRKRRAEVNFDLFRRISVGSNR